MTATTDNLQQDYAPRWPGIDLQYLETVDITIRGVRAATRMADGSVLFDVGPTEDHAIRLYPEDAQRIELARVAPADGEPQPGDIWADRHGTRLVAVRPSANSSAVSLYPIAGEYTPTNWLSIHRGASGPIRLVHRPGDDVLSGGAA